MNKPIITIEIDSNGNVKVEVENVQGPSCTKLTADLEKALGKVSNVQHKPEYTNMGQALGQQSKLKGGLA